MVLRMMGSSAYTTIAVTLGATPRPSGGISRPSRASDGIVNSTPAMVVARAEGLGRR